MKRCHIAADLAYSRSMSSPDPGFSAHYLSHPALVLHSPLSFLASSQPEKAYQKQDGVFIGKKKIISKQKSKGFRYYKSVGLGFKTPKVRPLVDLMYLTFMLCFYVAYCSPVARVCLRSMVLLTLLPFVSSFACRTPSRVHT